MRATALFRAAVYDVGGAAWCTGRCFGFAAAWCVAAGLGLACVVRGVVRTVGRAAAAGSTFTVAAGGGRSAGGGWEGCGAPPAAGKAPPGTELCPCTEAVTSAAPSTAAVAAARAVNHMQRVSASRTSGV